MERLGMRWILASGTWVWFVPVVEIGSNAITSDVTDMMVFATWVGLWVAWLAAYTPVSHSASHTTRVGWYSVPSLLILGAVVYGSQWPMTVRVWLCEDELRAHAERAEEGWKLQLPPARAGSFTIHATDRYAGVTDLMTRNDCFDVGGVTYAPNGLPPRHRNRTTMYDEYRPGGYRHLYGPWYRRVIRD